MKEFNKDPDADLDYAVDWSDWATPGESIAESVWLSSPSGLVLHDAGVEGLVARTWIAGGVLGFTYTVTNRVTTNSVPPRRDDRSFLINIRQR